MRFFKESIFKHNLQHAREGLSVSAPAAEVEGLGIDDRSTSIRLVGCKLFGTISSKITAAASSVFSDVIATVEDIQRFQYCQYIELIKLISELKLIKLN